MKTGELITIGGAYVDMNVPNFPLGENGLALEAEVVGGAYLVEPGGSAVNFAKMCASMSIPTIFIGKVGKDALGQILATQLSHAEVRPLLIESDEAVTNVSFNMVRADGKSIMAVAGTANQSLTADDVYAKTVENLPECPYLYIGGCFKLKKLLPAFVQLAREVKDTDTKIVLDHARLNASVTEDEKEIVKSLAVLSDIYLPSIDEFMQLWDATSLEEGMLSFSALSSETILVVKNSSEGALTVIDGKVVTVPSFPVTPIHTIGAGDSFNAGFIAAQYKGLDVLESIRFACATAALKISRPTLPTYNEVVDFLG